MSFFESLTYSCYNPSHCIRPSRKKYQIHSEAVSHRISLAIFTNLRPEKSNTHKETFAWQLHKSLAGILLCQQTLAHADWSAAGEHGAVDGYPRQHLVDQQQDRTTMCQHFAMMASPRRCVLHVLYSISTLLSIFLIYLSAFHCQLVSTNGCTSLEKQNQFTQFVAVFFACMIIIFSLCWLSANCQRVENSCLSNYNFLEMPNAVFCSLLAGVACVIEIHYNFDYSDDIDYTQKWTMVALVSGVLSCLHAALAFALT